MPLVVPQLRTITLGGAVSGLGIESTSFRSGLPHESVVEMDVFTGAGEVVTTRPGDDLFDAFPNSYGSLGYATRLRIELEPVRSHVALRHVRFDDAGLLAKTIAMITETREYAGEQVDGIDGVAFEPGEYYLTLARWSDHPGGGAQAERLRRPADLLPLDPAARDRPADHLRLPLALGHRLVLVLGRVRRPEPAPAHGSGRAGTAAPTSTTGWSAGTTASTSPTGSTSGPAARSASGSSRTSRSRSSRLPEFLDWFDAEIGMRPVWLCPLRLRAAASGRPYPLTLEHDVRQRRLLGHRPRRPRPRERAAEPRDRGQGARARRPQERSTPRRSTTARPSTASTTARTSPRSSRPTTPTTG